jgi:hypothetical protein
MSSVFLAVPHTRTRGPTGQVTDPWLAAIRELTLADVASPVGRTGGHHRHLPAAIVTSHLLAPSVPSRAATRPAVRRCPSPPARP